MAASSTSNLTIICAFSFQYRKKIFIYVFYVSFIYSNKIDKMSMVQLYPCDQCDYNPKYKSSLTVHKKSLQYGEQFPCNICEYKATIKFSLPLHEKIVHMKLKYRCLLCYFLSIWKRSNGNTYTKCS